MNNILLTDEEIKTAKCEAVRLSWTHKAHPSFEKEKFLLQAQHNKTYPIAKQEGFEIGIEQGKAEGKREVVEWITPFMQDLTGILGNPEGNKFILVSRKDWQAKLKEWGIE